MKLNSEIKRKLFNSQSYQAFLKVLIVDNDNTRGFKKSLADAAGCQPAYFSQVLAGKTHLTPEQAERLSLAWHLKGAEHEFFFHLVLLGRSGSASLSRRLENKLSEIRQSWLIDNETMGASSVSEPERAAIYYSHWLNTAIHLLLTVPGYNTAEQLCEHLKRPLKEIEDALSDLDRAGLVQKQNGAWRVLNKQIHAPQRDFFAEVHHKNWRAQAMELRNGNQETYLRYTSVHSISKSDLLRVRALLDEAIRNSRRIIEASPEETAGCLLIDYFSI